MLSFIRVAVPWYHFSPVRTVMKVPHLQNSDEGTTSSLLEQRGWATRGHMLLWRALCRTVHLRAVHAQLVGPLCPPHIHTFHIEELSHREYCSWPSTCTVTPCQACSRPQWISGPSFQEMSQSPRLWTDLLDLGHLTRDFMFTLHFLSSKMWLEMVHGFFLGSSQN